MSNSGTEGLLLAKEEIPIPRDRMGILDILSRVLTKPYVQNVRMGMAGVMTVEWYKTSMDSLLDEVPDISADDALSLAVLEEVDSDDPLKTQLVDTYLRIMLMGHVPTFILTPSIAKLRGALDLPSLVLLPKHALTGRPRYLGMQLMESESIQDGTVVICSSHTESYRLDAVVSGLKLFVR